MAASYNNTAQFNKNNLATILHFAQNTSISVANTTSVLVLENRPTHLNNGM